MLAIVEARIAADSTQGFSPAEQRVVVLVDRMVASSHGPALGLITTMTPLPFLDTYRTMCHAPGPAFREVSEGICELRPTL
jgi:hypothetical protein